MTQCGDSPPGGRDAQHTPKRTPRLGYADTRDFTRSWGFLRGPVDWVPLTEGGQRTMPRFRNRRRTGSGCQIQATQGQDEWRARLQVLRRDGSRSSTATSLASSSAGVAAPAVDPRRVAGLEHTTSHLVRSCDQQRDGAARQLVSLISSRSPVRIRFPLRTVAPRFKTRIERIQRRGAGCGPRGEQAPLHPRKVSACFSRHHPPGVFLRADVRRWPRVVGTVPGDREA